jgi:primosomal protein N'
MPPSISYFDYLVPETLQKKIKPGQLVKVPFRNKEEFGLVYSLEQNLPQIKRSIKLRALTEI